MEKKLQRDENSKMIAGVCAGLAEYFDVDVTWVRIAFILAACAGFSGGLAYIILWIAVPKKPFMPFGNPNAGSYRVYQEPVPPYSAPQPDLTNLYEKKKKDDNGKLVAGFILIGVGTCFLISQLNILPFWFSFWKLWPLAIIVPGIVMLSTAAKSSDKSAASPKEPIDITPEEPTTDTNPTDPSQNI